MLRLVLLVLYLASLYSLDLTKGDLTGNLDPNGLTAQPPGDIGGGLDPDGLTAQPPGDIGGGLDPNG